MIAKIPAYKRNYTPDTRPVFWCTSSVRTFSEGTSAQFRKNNKGKK